MVVFRILIADNELALVTKLETFLVEKGYEVVGTAVSGRQAVSMALTLNPDLILMEMKLAGEVEGIAAAKKIRAARDVAIVFLTWYGDEKSLSRAGLVHPDGYVLKPFQGLQVQAAIEVALGNRIWFRSRKTTPNEDTSLKISANNSLFRPINPFTPAENRVAGLIKEGMRSREIALKLKLAPSTVDWHRKNIRKKMGIAGNKTRNLMGNLSLLDTHLIPVEP
jgi:DNA-binding NarL/FixJ family response regulator